MAEEISGKKNLTNDLKEKVEAENIITKYEKYNHSKLHKSVMDIIVRANEERFKEVRLGMCDALVELMADIIEEKEEKAKNVGLLAGRAEGYLAKLCEQIQKKLTKGKTVAQIADELEETEDRIQELMTKMEIAKEA